jgi:ribosomal protein S18 acetylase RimI-like enzyme
MTLTTREPKHMDAARIADLHVATWREAYSHLLPHDFFTDEYIRGRREMWDHLLAAKRDGWIIRIAETDDDLAGFAFAGPSVGPKGIDLPRRRQLYMIYISAAHYGTGVGQRLLDETLGDEEAMLWVAKANPRAVAFYRRNGFQFDGTEQIDPGAPAIVDARMVR